LERIVARQRYESADRGIQAVPPGGFPAAFAEIAPKRVAKIAARKGGKP
jgi:hypothetical protein